MGYSVNANMYAPAILTVTDYEYFNHQTTPPTDQYITKTITKGGDSSSDQIAVSVGSVDKDGNPIYKHVSGVVDNIIMRPDKYASLTSASGLNVEISLVPSAYVTLRMLNESSPGILYDEDLLLRLPVYCNTSGTIPFSRVYANAWHLWYFDDSFEYPQLMRMDCINEFDFDWGGIEETPNTTIWKLDDNNDGYPWIWGWDESPKDKPSTLYLKESNGWTRINAYVKEEEGFVALQAYLKTEQGWVKCT